MNKFKKVMLGALSVLTLGLFVVTGAKVNATAVEYVTELDCSLFDSSKPATQSLTGITSMDKIVFTTAYAQAFGTDITTSTVNSILSKNSENKDSITYNYGCKIDSSGYLKFTPQCNDWTLSLVFTSATASQLPQVTNGTVTSVVANAANGLGLCTISGTSTSEVIITRSASKKALYFYELVLTQTYDENVSYTTVNYYDADGKTKLGEDTFESGSTTTAIASPKSKNLGVIFDCWVDSDGNKFDFSTKLSSDIDLFASYKTDSAYSTVVTDSNILDSDVIEYMVDNGYTTLSDDVIVTNSIYKIGKGCLVEEKTSNTNIQDKSFTYDIATNGSVQKTSQYVGLTAPADGKLIAYVKNGSGSSSRKVNLFTPGTQTQVNADEAVELEKNGVAVCEFTVEKDKSYNIGAVSGGSIYIYYLEFVANPTVAFNCQYDTENPAEATKIRFIATIDGIADVKTIDTVTFSVTVGEVTKEFKCTKVYSSISNKFEGFGAATGRYYAVFALSGIQSAISSGVSFTSMSVTVTFTSDSGLSNATANHDGFTLGTLGDN